MKHKIKIISGHINTRARYYKSEMSSLCVIWSDDNEKQKIQESILTVSNTQSFNGDASICIG